MSLGATTGTCPIIVPTRREEYDWLDLKELDVRQEFQLMPDEERERIVALYMRGYQDGYGDGY